MTARPRDRAKSDDISLRAETAATRSNPSDPRELAAEPPRLNTVEIRSEAVFIVVSL